MTGLTLLHTAQAHVETFAALAPEAALTHVVRPDWLARARGGADAALQDEISDAVRKARGPVLCTCTTIGGAAEAAGATRIDWPMMQEAARTGGPVLMAYCLDSTRLPSAALLHRAFGGRDPQLSLLDLQRHWPRFVAGDTKGFADAIAADVLAALDGGAFACAVLAQASMAAAANLLKGKTAVPVLASPEIALRRLLRDGAGRA